MKIRKTPEQVETERIAHEIEKTLQAALDPFYEAMDESAPPETQIPQVLGLLLGFRSWTARMVALEEALMPLLAQMGISREAYYATVQMGSEIQVAETLQTLFEGAGKKP